ncbi:MAG: bifunctional UDP-N-acetylglucosamine diphosphorylase/glucosamine-1-phosphate N-acetyltransferase GlmU [Armatimonadota bacterium]|nr:bifunctional UDP-N-acetylglucosamine diphosphorylase/glucosamine-1-phosphate N-acetyltransferase GlmU [Armatimonadota bacterium]
MSTPSLTAVVMAAGKSTRMKSRLPKPLHPLCGKPLLSYLLDACQSAGVSRTIVVVGHEAERVQQAFHGQCEFALQEEQLGTGHAVMSARGLLEDYDGDLLVLPGDTPLIDGDTLRQLVEHHRASGAVATVLSAVLPHDAGMYGRVLRDSGGKVVGIVEAKDATPEQLAVREINTSIYCFHAPALFHALQEVRPENAQGEYYLTDVIGLFTSRGEKVEAVVASDWQVTLGVNTRVELADVASRLRWRILERLMLSGVTIIDPSNTYIDADVQIGQDTTVHPNTYILGSTTIGEECEIGPMARIENSQIGNRTRVLASQVVESRLGDDVRVGPFANLRPGTVVGNGSKIGDFVEVKNAIIEENVSMAHLTYVGDAHVGANSNIGAGTITCNYDGRRKHRTVIGKGCFIGSHATLIAPVQIGDGAYVAAASPITEDVPPDSLAIARCRQVVKEGWAKRRREESSSSGG